jgi:uncharacterized protein YprB with RNaseH-like and TPR domain
MDKRWELDALEQANLLCTLDIEASNLGADFGRIICAVVKPFHGKPREFVAKNLEVEKAMLKELVTYLNRFQCVITHYGSRFDLPFIQSRMTYHNLAAENVELRIRRQIDTIDIAWKNLRMSKNHLANLCKSFKLPVEKKGLSPDEWTKVMEDFGGNIKRMVKYCKQDVLATEGLYKHLRHLAGNAIKPGTPYSI